MLVAVVSARGAFGTAYYKLLSYSMNRSAQKKTKCSQKLKLDIATDRCQNVTGIFI